ncbi:MAG TPA: CocE/NonD family hydrolase [Conexibacter sp.]
MSEELEQGDVTVTVAHDVPARMRDGVVLRANVYRPAGDGPWPTLLCRTPYDKNHGPSSELLDAVRAARAGFMVVVQDTRGRFTSEGEWTPFKYEREDGYDTVEWAARLPGSNGRVGMFGDSYMGNTQWMAAVEQPPSLGAIAPGVTWHNPLDGLFARGGALELGVALPWDLRTGVDHIARQSGSAEERARRTEALIADYDRLPVDGYWDLPVDGAMPALQRHGVPDIGSLAMLADPDVPSWCRVEGRHERVTAPTLNLGGWYDIFAQGAIDNYMAMTALGRPARLVVGSWHHMLPAREPHGELSFGLRSNRFNVPAYRHGDLTDEQLAWMRRWLDPDAADDDANEPPVRIFTMGRNSWRDEPGWPLPRARTERWHLHADGGLAPAAPDAGAEPSTFAYDPADPVPTVGGQLVMSPAYPPGAFDQDRVEARPDVLVFTSEPLQQELEVTGRVTVVLHAASSAPSTDWVARLCDVHPDGRSYNLCDGIVRVSEGADELRRIEIDLWSTSIAFLPGHRLRVHVTSSSFPRWDRNLNTGDQRSARFETARQLVRHDADHPSWIELPVVG